MSTPSFIKVESENCIGCGVCVDECPMEAIVIENDVATILEDCSGCLSCLEACPCEALVEAGASPAKIMPQPNQRPRP